MNIPNLLTILRIFFVPLLVAALVQEHASVWLALGIFLVAASTDLLDGYLARRWRQITTIGTLLDPIADKLLISSALIALVQVRAVQAWMVIRQLKMKKGVKLFSRLPPLGTLDNLISNSMGFGFVFITLGVIAGSTWASIESGTAWIKDPRIALAFITWGFYLTMVFLRQTAGWRGRKAALMAVAVLCCSGLTWAAHVGLRSLISK